MAVNGFEGMVRPLVGQAIGPGGRRRRGRDRLARAAACLVAAVRGRCRRARPDRGAADAGAPRPLRRRHQHPVRGALADMREGSSYMVRTPWLLATLLFASLMILVMMGPFEVLVPFLIKDRLGGDAGDHALVLAAFGIGGAVGSLAMASLRMPRRYLTWMNLMFGRRLPAAGRDGRRHGASGMLVVSAFVLGALFSAPMVIWGTLLQRRVPPTCSAGSPRSTSSSRSA